VEDDRHHGEAVAVFPKLLKRGLVTTNLVVAETYIVLRRAAGYRAAISFLELVGASPRIKKLYSDPRLEDEAERILRHYPDQAGYRAAISFLELVGASPRIKKLYSDPRLEDEAERILRHYPDQDFSFVDAVSFAAMKRERIEEAFAFDRHFLIMGFRTVPPYLGT